MTKDTQRDLSPLLPERHPQLDFFVCDIFDATPKSDTASMEHPLFSLSTKPDHTRKEYRHGDAWVKIAPSPDGCATVHDRDVLIYCISQLMAAINQGRKVARQVRFHANDLLSVTNRATSGEGYRLLQSALRRLQGTQLETNITTGGKEQWRVFSFIESAQVIKETREGRMLELEITLSDWVFNAINEKGGDLLTISRDYFRLRKPLERRLYEIARKSCGQKNPVWKFKVETLREKTGSRSTPREFRRMLTKIINENATHAHIPDYTFNLEEDTVIIRPRREFRDVYSAAKDDGSTLPQLSAETYEKAKAAAPGYDVYWLEQEWREFWADSGKQTVKNPAAAFVAFCKRRHERKPNA